jgi:hypothetical protein
VITALLAVGLIGLCLYSGLVGPGDIDTIPEALAHPEQAAGRTFELGSDVTVLRVHAHGFDVEQLGGQAVVRIPPPLQAEWERCREYLTVGDYVSLRAVFQPPHSLLLEEVHVHTGRRLKIWVSAIAFLVFAAIVLRSPWSAGA